jgi:hypothetical protein
MARDYGTTQMDTIRAIYEDANAALRDSEDANVEVVLGAYQRAQEDILAAIEAAAKAEPGGQLTLDGMQMNGRLGALLQSIHQTAQQAAAHAGQVIEQSAVDQYLESYQRSVYGLDQATPDNVAVQYAPPPESAIRILANAPYKGAMFSQRIGIITDEMASDVRDELMQGLVAGESMAEISDRISGVIGAGSTQDPEAIAYRASVIARSEIMRTQNAARDTTYEQNADIVEDSAWEVAPDDKLCDWCARREGLTDEEIKAQDPGDDPWGNSTDKPLHPNCRCDSVPKLKSWKDLLGLDMPEEFKDDERGMRNDEGDWIVAPVESFDDWLERRGLEAA